MTELNTDQGGTAAAATYFAGDSEVVADERPRFEAGYVQHPTLRVYRKRIRVEADGTATMTFLGQVPDATTMWVSGNRRGGINVYAEVATDETTATTVKVAVVPTGKRVPALPDLTRALRLGSTGGRHVYLLSVDGTTDREAYLAQREARREAERAEREAAQAAMLAADFDFGDDSPAEGSRTFGY